MEYFFELFFPNLQSPAAYILFYADKSEFEERNSAETL